MGACAAGRYYPSANGIFGSARNTQERQVAHEWRYSEYTASRRKENSLPAARRLFEGERFGAECQLVY